MRIQIIKTPQGDAPESVREQWVGLILPCTNITDKKTGVTLELSTPDVVPDDKLRKNVFVVPQKEALEILADKSREAANWFYNHGMPLPLCTFTFAHDEAKLVGPTN